MVECREQVVVHFLGYTGAVFARAKSFSARPARDGQGWGGWGNLNDANKLIAKVDELKLEVGQLEKRVNKFQEPAEYKNSVSDTTVKFMVGGKPVYFQKWRKQRLNDLREQFKLIDAVVDEMRQKGVKVTTTTLRQLGIGGELSSRYIHYLYER